MSNTWKYKIDLINENVFNEIENERKITFPNELKNLIISSNASTPEKYKYMLGNIEKVFGAVLSFNRNEAEADSVFNAFEVITDSNLIPFGIDSFGNYICYSVSDGKILFWDHETDGISLICDSLSSFLDSLY